MRKITKLLAYLTPAFLFISLFLSPARAFFVQSGNNVILPVEKKIDEAVLVTGSSLTIDSNINGDLYCAGKDVIINGNIKGDVACAAQNIKINGLVDGNIRVLAQTVDIAGQTTRNLTTATQKLTLEPKAQIKGDIFFAAQNAELDGTMGRDLAGASETISITGSLVRNAVVTGKTLSVIETGKIGGNLDYYMEKTATASVGLKSVKGTVTRHEIVTPAKPEMEKKVEQITPTLIALKVIMGIISYMLLGFVLIYLNRGYVEKRMSLISKKPVASGFIGLAILIVAPIVFIVLMITVIGMPIAFLAMIAYVAALITASLYPSAVYGRLFIGKVLKKQNSSLYWEMFTGVIILGLLVCIPVIGWLIGFISFCLGLGAIFTSLSPNYGATSGK